MSGEIVRRLRHGDALDIGPRIAEPNKPRFLARARSSGLLKVSKLHELRVADVGLAISTSLDTVNPVHGTVIDHASTQRWR
jgi:hypothetical protein